MVTNNVSEGSCVTQGGGGEQHRIRKKLKSLYICTLKCPNKHKNLDFWHLLNKYSPKTQNFDVFFTSRMKSLIKMQNLNNCLTFFLSREEEKGLIVKYPLLLVLTGRFPFGLSLFRHHFCITFQLFKLLCLA